MPVVSGGGGSELVGGGSSGGFSHGVGALNYAQVKRLLVVFYTVESGQGGYKQFSNKTDVDAFILRGVHTSNKKTKGFLYKNFSMNKSEVVASVQTAKHPEQFFLTNTLLSYIDKTFIN